MINWIKNIPIRFKLIGSFLVIILINAISGVTSLNNIKDLSALVNTTYDKALMAATFSQAAKFSMSQVDSRMKTALLTKDPKTLKINKILCLDDYETLIEDLDVVMERNLDKKNNSRIKKLKEDLKEVKKVIVEVLNKKEQQLRKGYNLKNSLELFNYWDSLKVKKKMLRGVTAVHDEAAELGYLFRIESDKKNKKTIERTFLIFGVCLVLSLIISFLIALSFIKPLFKLRRVCEDIQQGDFETRSDVNRGDEFGMLARAFDFMLDTIQEKTENISSLLEALPFGLFYVDKEGKISEEKSPETTKIFEHFNAYESLPDFYKNHGIEKEQIEQVLQAAFGELLPFNAALRLLPSELSMKRSDGKEQFVDITFRPNRGKKNSLDKVILLAEDVTKQKEDEIEREKLFKRVERISKVSDDLDNFLGFVPNVKELMEKSLFSLQKNIFFKNEELLRDLHTAKGLLGFYNFDDSSHSIHQVEDLLNQENLEEAKKQLNVAIELFRDQVNDVIAILNLEDSKNFVSIPAVEFKELKGLAKGTEDKPLAEKILEIDRLPMPYLMKKYEKYLNLILEKNKGKEAKIIVNENQRMSREILSKVDPMLVHLLNNSVAHGIESIDKREEAGKEKMGNISLSVEYLEDEKVKFVFEDDGKGMDPEVIYNSAKEKGLIDNTPETDEEKLNLIFLSGFSTQEEASDIAGRGVGMDAIKNEVESYGGLIELESTVGKGTKFILTLPQNEE